MTFVDVTLWGRTAEVACEYLTKGSPVLIEGRLKLDTWEGSDGQKRSKLCVVGDRMQMVGSRGGASGGATAARRAAVRAERPPRPRAADDPVRPVRPTTTLATCLRPSRPAAMIFHFSKVPRQNSLFKFLRVGDNRGTLIFANFR